MSLSEWELLKENVEPIKQGRNMSSLSAALLNDHTVDAKRDAVRRQFEAELRDLNDDDGLDIYYKYILWLEQNYPLGGNDAKLPTVIQSCIERFQSVPQYQNDSRLLEIFFKFVKQVDNPLELFNFFYESGFASKLAEFYANWSFHLENNRNVKRAYQVLALGVDNRAEPSAALIRAQQELQSRVAKAVVTGNDEQLNENADEPQSERRALNKLKECAKRGKSVAPISRVGNNITQTKNAKQVAVSQHKHTKKLNTIYNDENDSELIDLLSNAKQKTVNTKAENIAHVGRVGQENEMKPGKWCDNKIDQKCVQTNAKPTFEILLDDNPPNDAVVNIYKPPESNALKVRIKNPNSPPLARFEKPDPLKKFMFDEKRIYAGGEEFSFEEIRGRKWMDAKRKEDEAHKNRKLEQEVELLRQQIALLLSRQKNICFKQADNKVEAKQVSPPHTSSAESSSAKSMSNVCESKGALSMMRELWNGTLANTECTDQKSLPINDEQLRVVNKFSIFPDNQDIDTLKPSNNKTQVDIDDNYLYQNETIALPKCEEEFVQNCAHSASTPMPDRKGKKVFTDCAPIQASHNGLSQNNFVGGMTAKLSPIVETSREYNSKSSSSSGTISRTLSNRQEFRRTLDALGRIDRHSRN